ncbi:GNAT family N-acetyltransferase [Micromonospora sp. PLK6-60]|uniref:GNAT family N-acetyltransferase n=1 Tax=Micromonospora sp. PLK6-60 TaxID=2873383 RepID=UPI001CA62495|nr:GNAT family N-acetyltransferase [Micromonospora sp. PLK6-60]MBY8873280.1 GNAT family N-acetyltransferase [Micromonospora sp. PLK6-60]
MRGDGCATTIETGPLGDLSSIVSAWVRGWTISRATPPPVPAPHGWQVDVGLPGHRRRFVLHAPDERTLTRLGRHQNAPGTWIKVAGDPAELRAALPPEWQLDDTGYLMTTTFRAAAEPPPPPPYAVRVQTSGGVVTAEVLDPEGRIAASGKLATTGAYAIVDQVETATAHRRRGLGTVVMRTLAWHALRRGAGTGILVATDDGRGLYGSLGWTVRSPIAVACVPEPAAA